MIKSSDDLHSAPRRGARAVLLPACVVTAALLLSTGQPLSSSPVASGAPLGSSVQVDYRRQYAGVVVSFDFEQTTATTDQITILFTNAPADANLQAPVTGADCSQEFVFSGRDYPKDRVTFSRRVPNRSFLDCRFVRVLNRGSNRWLPLTISLTVDGQPVLDKVSMYPRKGANPRGGIERWGEANATFWETELQRFRRRAS